MSLLFLLFFPLYSFLQDGRFTTKRQRESPINLVANHALDSSVDLCLCPSVCIFSFLFPVTVSIFLFFYLIFSSFLSAMLFFCTFVDVVSHSHLIFFTPSTLICSTHPFSRQTSNVVLLCFFSSYFLITRGHHHMHFTDVCSGNS